MPLARRYAVRAIARALLAGPVTPPSLAARIFACVGERPDWARRLALDAHTLTALRAGWMRHRDLTDWIDRHPAFPGHRAVPIRRYILRPGTPMRPLPLGLDQVTLPAWTDSRALAAALQSTPSVAGLWRLTKPAAWQRRDPLGEQHYRYHLLPKRRGGWRLVEAPAPHLKGLQRRLLDELLHAVPVHEAAMGFVRERSVVDHARAHTGQPVVLSFDLRNFFSSVRSARVKALFSKLGYSDEVARLLTALCTTATPEPVLQRLRSEGGLDWHQSQMMRGAHLPQGAPTSPALANLCAFRLDLRLDGLAHVLGARYTRYADDLVISGPSQLATNFRRVEAWVGCIAMEEGFALNFRKSRCRTAARRQEVCHMVVNVRPNLPREEFDRLRAVLHSCVQRGPAGENRDGHPNFRGWLEGRVAWATQINPDKARRLQKLLGAIDWTR
jgi:hypothetical protein